MRLKPLLLFCAATAFYYTPLQAQGLLKKIKDKVNQTVNTTSTNTSTNQPGNGNTQTNRNTGNTTGEGLVITPPDVNENLTSAEAAFKNGNYNEARYAVQQAMLGVEM
jgi:hypothetical protein